MKKALIANIGNRNILYNGQTIRAENKGQDYTGDTFYSITKLLYELQNFQKITPNILPPLFEKFHAELDRALFIGSEQQPPQSQDTYYEALILKEIFSQMYPAITFEVVCTSVVVDMNPLIVFYRNLLKPFQESGQAVIICDAGGTAQQKMALKIAAEYTLKYRQFEVYNVKQDRALQSSLEKVEPIEFRKILDLETALSLVKRGNFEGALSILKNIQCELPIIHFIEFVKFRFTLRYEEARKIGENNKQIIQGFFPKIEKFLKREPAEIYTKEFKEVLDRNQFFNLREILLVAQYLYLKRELTDSFLQFHIFAENYLGYLLKKLYGIDVERSGDRERIREKIVSNLKNQAHSFFQLQVLLCYESERKLNFANKGIVNELFSLIGGKNNLNNNFSELRNKIVHKGVLTSAEEIENKCPYYAQAFSKTLQKFEILEPSHNFYRNAEKVIERELR
jgi:hypothetical protein